jgi:prevent-host-death family protein
MATLIAILSRVPKVTAYSVADAKNTLPKLIDRALEGEEVVITRHGKAVVEIRPLTPSPATPGATYAWLQGRRRKRPGVGLSSVEILDRLYEGGEAG